MAWAAPRLRPGRLERGLERAIAVGYAVAYDAVVRGFAPYEALLDDVAALVRASGPGPLRVLDVACGTGTVARRLAREGHAVVGLDPVEHLVRRAQRVRHSGVVFQHADMAAGTAFPAGSFDVCVSLHTINWHPRREALLAECRRLLRPGGHAIVLSYTRPAAVRATFRDVRAQDGLGRAVSALRWLVPTAVFEACRHYTPHYPDPTTLSRDLEAAGFAVRASHPAFLAGISRLVWARVAGDPAELHPTKETP